MQTPSVLHIAAEVLRVRKNEILLNWENVCRSHVPAARKQSRPALRDSLPEFLDELIKTLYSADPLNQAELNSEVAKEHGEERATQQEYDLEQVIYEYQLLRKVIKSELEAEGCFAPDVVETIYSFIEHGIRKASVTYAEIEETFQAAQRADLSASRLEAERANLAKTAFLANMSHEIRTPLGAIMGFVSLLKDDDTTSSEAANYLDTIERHSHHLLRIVDDILDLTKVESGKMSVDLSEFSLTQFLAEFSSFAGLKARENGLSFELKVETLLPDKIVCDPTRLRQILSNTVGNAVKFTEKGKVELHVLYADGTLRLTVTDTGKGISREQRANLFQAFAQVDSSSTRKFGGTGLGLLLTKKLCEALGGDFNLLKSKIGKGSTFEAVVPVTVPETSKFVSVQGMELRAPAEFAVAPPPDLSKLKILLVEDSPDNQILIKLMLGKVGITLDIASNGKSGVSASMSKSYDVILMDIQMPIMDGHEAARTLRANHYTKPIVALTAHAMREERERAEASGFSHFLTKPINRKNLIDLLEVLMTHS